MNLGDFLSLLRVLVVDHGFAVLWRVSLMTFLGAGLSLLLLLVCYRGLYRKGRLKLGWAKERYYEAAVMAGWVLTIPLLAILSGMLAGTWWAGHHLIGTERLGEHIGKRAFKAVAVGVAAAQLEKTVDKRAEVVDAMLQGRQKISVKELSLFTSHHVGEMSALKIQSYLPVKSAKLHGVTVWTVEKTLDYVAYTQLGGQGDVVYRLAGKVAEYDRLTDNDGLVTVEEISDVACKTYLNGGAKTMWALLALEFLIPLLLLLLLLPIGPPLLAWAVRALVAWRTPKLPVC